MLHFSKYKGGDCILRCEVEIVNELFEKGQTHCPKTAKIKFYNPDGSLNETKKYGVIDQIVIEEQIRKLNN